MSIRIRAALTGAAALAAVASVGLIAPAAMADPKLPDGCTFDRSTGTSTCITKTVGDKTTPTIPAGNQGADGTPAGTFCATRSPGYVVYAGGPAASVSSQTITTTTSTFQGAYNPQKPVRSSSSSSTIYTVESGVLGCGFVPLNPREPRPGDLYHQGETAVVTN